MKFRSGNAVGDDNESNTGIKSCASQNTADPASETCFLRPNILLIDLDAVAHLRVQGLLLLVGVFLHLERVHVVP